MGALGLVTIAAYGSWFYGFGAMVDDIRADTGWSATSLGLTYGAAQALVGVGAFPAGRLVDRAGARLTFLLMGLGGGGLLLAASWAGSVLVFGLVYAAGAGIVGATGFYAVTTAVAARLHGANGDRAVAMLTVFGAFASPVVLPLSAWLVEAYGWRVTARALAATAIVGGLVGAGALWSASDAASARPAVRARDAVARALGDRSVRRLLGAYLAGGFSFAAILVYQLPIMTAAGISLGVAGVIGGLRGFFQVFGRIGLTGAIARHGSGSLLTLAYAGSAVGVAFLALGTVPSGIGFAVVAGTMLGASSPLQAIHARSFFGDDDLGLLMALQAAALGLSGAIGPVVGGLLNDATGSWQPTIWICVAMTALAAALVPRNSSARPCRR